MVDGGSARAVEAEVVRPYIRSVGYTSRLFKARLAVEVSPRRENWLSESAPAFILGCGRSGTTLLGELLSLHPAVAYFYEPYDRWAAIDARTDVLHLYSRRPSFAVMTAEMMNSKVRSRFTRAMKPPSGRLLVEKSPINSLRIGYLEALARDARYVHIVRDGIDVAASIRKLARRSLRMPGIGTLNEWWGVDDVKWDLLVRDTKGAVPFGAETDLLTGDDQRGSYEWVVSLLEIERWTAALGDRLLEIRYDHVTSDPRIALTRIAEHLNLSLDHAWLDRACSRVAPARTHEDLVLSLPTGLAAVFNQLEEHWDFPGRAEVAG